MPLTLLFCKFLHPHTYGSETDGRHSLECDAHDTDQSERQTSQAVKTLHTKGKDRKSTNIPETAIISVQQTAVCRMHMVNSRRGSKRSNIKMI